MDAIGYSGAVSRVHGLSGGEIASVIYKVTKSLSSMAQISYDESRRVTVIQNLGDECIASLKAELARIILREFLTDEDTDGWWPEVVEKKDSEGNLLVKFLCVYADANLCLYKGVENRPQPRSIISYSQILNSCSAASNVYQATSDDGVRAVKESLSSAAINAMRTIMANPKKDFVGIWYFADFAEFCLQNKKDPSKYANGHAPERYFDRVGYCQFQLRTGCQASEAIQALMAGPSVLDCINAVQLAYSKAVLDLIGADKFDYLVSNSPSNSFGGLFKISQDNGGMFGLLSRTSGASQQSAGSIGHRPLNVGDICYFKGVDCYPQKHPAGTSTGMCVIYSGDNESGEQLFVGLGFESALTEREINRFLVEDHNKDRSYIDEIYIRKHPSDEYAVEKNSLLRSKWTLDVDQSDSSVEGFVSRGCREFKFKYLAHLHEMPKDSKLIKAFLEIPAFGLD